MVLASPFLLAGGLGLGFLAFLGWAEKDSKTQRTKFILAISVLPGIFGWVIGIAEIGYDCRPDTWWWSLIRIGHGLIGSTRVLMGEGKVYRFG